MMQNKDYFSKKRRTIPKMTIFYNKIQSKEYHKKDLPHYIFKRQNIINKSS
jgi:hypothetical protein